MSVFSRLWTRFQGTSIRARLLFVYLGLLLIGFGALTVVAGKQTAQAARADFEQRLMNEVRLLGQGLSELLYPRYGDRAEVPPEALEALIDEYERQLNASITLYTQPEHTNFPPNREFRDAPELETAMRDGLVVVERLDEQGHPALFTGIALGSPPREGGPGSMTLVQVSMPLDNLQSVILERWLLLIVVLLAVLAVTAAAALLTARSIIRPLYQLRDAAVRLSHGDLDYRVQSPGTDEIGEVGRAFNQMAKRVQNMVEEQRAYASNASHELRTPLTTIRLRSEALRYDDGLESSIMQQYIREIDEEAQRMSSLLDDLTLLSRFDAGRAERGHDQIDMHQFANSLVQRFRPQLEANQLRFSLDLAADLPPVFASINHLTVVFRNLIENALKYTPSGGAITWSMRCESNGIRHTIHDTGHGIETDHLPHLFERFYRADKARSRDIPGYGLGLAIVKSIIEMYGGSIAVTSDGKDRGTTISVFLPSAQ